MNIPRLLLPHLPTVAILMGWLSVSSGHAASVSSFGIGKAERYEQTSEATPVAYSDAYAFKAFAVPVSAGSAMGAFVTVPGGLFPMFLSGEELFSAEQTFSDLGTLDGSYPTGEYTFTIIAAAGMEEGKLSLASGTFPNIPQIADYAAAQAADRTKDFVLSWNAFAGATAGDFVQVTITDEGENVVFQTGWPGQATMLDGSARSVTIPANRLGTGTQHGLLSFTRAATRSTTALAGATGYTTFARETIFTLKTGGGGTGGDDTTAPVVLSSKPANLATGVATNTAVVFTFSEPMAPMQEINWAGAVLDQGKFSYSWSGDARTLTCTYAGGFPPNSMIVWALETSGFQDLAGNELDGENAGGFFRTGAGQSNPDDPCNNPPEDDGLGAVSVFKSYDYVQTGTAAPVPAGTNSFTFMATLASPTTNPVTQATLVLPNGSSMPMENLFGKAFSVLAEFATKEALDAAYPSGTYKVNIQRASGSAVLTVNLSVAGDHPIPQVANFPAVQQFDPKVNFTLQWNPFSGATDKDHLSIALFDKMGTIFAAPDLCIPRPLTIKDTSIVVPQNTFSSGSSVEGTITFSKYSMIDTNSYRDIFVMAGVMKQTSFKMGTLVAVEISLQNFIREAGGTCRFQVKAPVGSTLVVEASDDLVTWSPIMTGAAPSGSLDVTDSDNTARVRRYYRARTLF